MIEEVDGQIIKVYMDAGYKPQQVIKSLAGILGAACLTATVSSAKYSSDNFSVKIEVEEHESD